MPWWAIIYLLVFIAFSIVADTLGEFDGTKRLRWFADLLAGVIFAVLFAGFWLTSIYNALGFVAPVLLLAALAWEIYSAPSDFARDLERPRVITERAHRCHASAASGCMAAIHRGWCRSVQVLCSRLTSVLHRTAAPRGSRTVWVICQRLPTGVSSGGR